MNTMLRIPIARLGRWYHPVYKNSKGEPVVEFNQEDFDSIKTTFITDDRGYEPYLTYGHVKSNFDKYTADGFPIEGHLVRLEQVDDVLYGDFKPNNYTVIADIASGKYNYASGEFVRGLPSKETGAKIRVFLKGVALTNTPFVPNLPRNTVNLVSEELTEIVLLSESMELGDISVATENKCAGEDCTDDMCKCSDCMDAKSKSAAPMKASEESLENAQPNVVESTEDVKEIKSMLSEMMTKLKETIWPAPKQEKLSEEPKIEEASPVLEHQPAQTEENPPMEDNKPDAVDVSALEAELAALKMEKAKLEADKQALADRASVLEQERITSEKAAAEQKLSDEVNGLVEAGLAPAVADKVKTLLSANMSSVVSLSEGDEISLGDAVLDLVKSILEPSNRIDLDQVGASADTATLSDDADNPWADVIKKYKDKKSQ